MRLLLKLPAALMLWIVAVLPVASQNGQWGPLLVHGDGWGSAPAIPVQATHMIHMPEGKVLVFDRGVNHNNQVVTRLYVYEFATGVLTQLSNHLPENMFCAGHAMLPDGRIVIAGGGFQETAHGRVFIFDPSTLTWDEVEEMLWTRWYPTITCLGNGLIGSFNGQITPPGDEEQYGVHADEVEVYDPIQDLWTQMVSIPEPLAQEYYPFMFVVHDPDFPNDQNLVYVGKRLRGGALDVRYGAHRLRITSSGDAVWTRITDRSDFRGSAAVIWVDGTYPATAPVIFKGAGRGESLNQFFPVATFKKLDLNTPPDPSTGLIPWVDLPDMNWPRLEAGAVLLADGRIAFVGGASHHRNRVDPVPTIEVFCPWTSTWLYESDPMAATRMYHSSEVLLPDASILTGGGEEDICAWYINGREPEPCDVIDNPHDPEHSFRRNEKNAQAFSPAYLQAGQRPVITFANDLMPYNNVYTVFTEDHPSTIEKVTLVRLNSSTHSWDMNQRFINMTLAPTQQFGPGYTVSVYTPANAGVAPPGYYMLFLINDQGVPSLAKYVKLQ